MPGGEGAAVGHCRVQAGSIQWWRLASLGRIVAYAEHPVRDQLSVSEAPRLSLELPLQRQTWKAMPRPARTPDPGAANTSISCRSVLVRATVSYSEYTVLVASVYCKIIDAGGYTTATYSSYCY